MDPGANTTDFRARARARFARAAPLHAPASSSMPLVAYVVGARPNFVKMAPVIEAMRRRGHTRQLVVHTGQHYDRSLSDDILADLGFPDPDIALGVGSGTHARPDRRRCWSGSRRSCWSAGRTWWSWRAT